MRVDQALRRIEQEFHKAQQAHPPMASVHEGYAVILEELDELWDEVKQRPSKRVISAIRLEAIQVAAMALRFLVDLVPEENGVNYPPSLLTISLVEETEPFPLSGGHKRHGSA